MTGQFPSTPADRLREARERAGFETAAAAARAHDWAEGTYRHHENGTRGIPARTAAIYAKAYGITVDWIFGDGSHTAKDYAGSLQATMYTDSEAAAGSRYSAMAHRSFGAVMLRKRSLSSFSVAPSNEEHADFFAIDSSIIEQVAPGRSSTPLTFNIVIVDGPSKFDGITQGAVLLLDLHASQIKRQGVLVLYTYSEFSGVATIFRHPDDTAELLHVSGVGSSIRVPLRDLRLWGQVLWIGQPPK